MAPIQRYPLRNMLGRAGEVVFWVFVVWVVVGSFVGWLLGISPHRVSEGDPCGPAHHWTYLRTDVTDPDLSCEPDR